MMMMLTTQGGHRHHLKPADALLCVLLVQIDLRPSSIRRPRPHLAAEWLPSHRQGLREPEEAGVLPSALGRSPRCGGPESGICGPVLPTGTLFVTSMAPVDYHLDLAPLGVRHALSHPQIHVSRARVSVPPPTLQWPIRRPPAHIVCAFASLSASLHLPYLWQVCRRRERRHRGRWRAPQSPAEPSALAAERHSRGRARATRSSGSPAGR